MSLTNTVGKLAVLDSSSTSLSVNGGVTLANNPFSTTLSNGSLLSVNSQSITDTNTAANTTAVPNFTGVYIGQSTLNAANASVTTNAASTLYIQGAPLTGTNEIIGKSYALNVGSGLSLLGGNLNVSGSAVSLGTGQNAILQTGGNTTTVNGTLCIMNGTNDYYRMISALDTNMSNTSRYWNFGQSTLQGNSMEMEFRYNTSNAATNYFKLGFAGNGILTCLNSGNVGILNATPAYTLDVAGSGRYTSDLTSNNYPIGYRNRVINGSMRIDQRNVGNVVTNNGYVTDRFPCTNYLSTTVTFQQTVLGASGAPPIITTAPAFVNALTFTNGSNTTTTTNAQIQMSTCLEGNNIVDLMWGTAQSKTATVSFWAYSSVAGQYSFTIINAQTSVTSYVATYSINTANTWQQIVLTVPGPTIGTWNNDNSLGIQLLWFLHGSTYQNASTLRTWYTASSASNNQFTSSTQTNLGSIANSTFSITGVQFEIGTIATPFEWRPFDVVLRQCQRYYEKSYQYSDLPGSAPQLTGTVTDASPLNGAIVGRRFLITKRATPSTAQIRFYSSTSQLNYVSTFGNNNAVISVSPVNLTPNGYAYLAASGTSQGTSYFFWYVVEVDF